MESHCYWSSYQEWQLAIVTDTLLLTSSGQAMVISHCCYQLVVKNSHFTLLLTSSGQEWPFHIAWHLLVRNGNILSGQEWQFHIAILMSSGQEWQFHIATDLTDMSLSRMAISHQYCNLTSICLVVNNAISQDIYGNFTMVLTSSGQEWPFHIARIVILTSSSQEWHLHTGTDI